jgi:hypothetical protein
MTDYDTEEPTIELLDGSVVLRGIFDLVRDLQAKGYTITIDADSEVSTVPEVHEDILWVLASNRSDVEAVLDSERPSTAVAVTPTATTIH